MIFPYSSTDSFIYKVVDLIINALTNTFKIFTFYFNTIAMVMGAKVKEVAYELCIALHFQIRLQQL